MENPPIPASPQSTDAHKDRLSILVTPDIRSSSNKKKTHHHSSLDRPKQITKHFLNNRGSGSKHSRKVLDPPLSLPSRTNGRNFHKLHSNASNNKLLLHNNAATSSSSSNIVSSRESFALSHNHDSSSWKSNPNLVTSNNSSSKSTEESNTKNNSNDKNMVIKFPDLARNIIPAIDKSNRVKYSALFSWSLCG